MGPNRIWACLQGQFIGIPNDLFKPRRQSPNAMSLSLGIDKEICNPYDVFKPRRQSLNANVFRNR